MLRTALLTLLALNAGYFAWSQHWLAPLSLQPHDPAEPHRLQQQIQPHALTLDPPRPAAPSPTATTPPGAPTASTVADTPSNTPPSTPPDILPSTPPSPTATTATPAGHTPATQPPGPPPQATLAPQTPTPAPATVTAPPLPANPATASAGATATATICLQSTHLDATQAQTLQTALHSLQLPAGSWSMAAVPVQGRWMVYLGKFPNTAVLEQRRSELRAKGIEYAAADGEFAPGLSLGRFSIKDGATRTLAAVQRKGVKDATIVQERPPSLAYVLRLPRATSAVRQRINQIPPRLLADKPLRLCGGA